MSIETQKALIEHGRTIIPTLPTNIKEDDKSNISKPEPLLDGIVTVKQYEGKGFSINLAELLRRLKRNLFKLQQ